jgi:PAS domain S-box-containing protein
VASRSSNSFRHSATLTVGRRIWTLHFRTRPAFAAEASWPLPPFVLAGGSLISLLVFGITRSLGASQQRAVALANQMTERLRLQERAMLASSDGMFILDATREGHPIIYTNPTFVEMTGYSLEEGLGHDTAILLREDPTSSDLLRLRAALKAGSRNRTVVHERRKDGTPFWAELRLSPVRGDHGQTTHFLGILQDITERRCAEEELAKAQKRHQELLHNLSVGVYRNTPGAKGRFLEANPALAAMLEAGSKEELLLHNVSEFYVDPARRGDISEKLARTGWLRHEELELQTLKGRRFWASITAVRREDEAGNVHFDGVIEDISERKEVAETLQRERILLRTVLDNLPDVIYAKDVQCRKTLANRADLRIMGCQTEAEALGKTDSEFYSQEAASRFFADDQAVMQTGQPVLGRDEFFVDAHGQSRWLLTSKLPLRDESGRIIGLVGIGRDITKRILAEQALRESQERFALAVQGTNDGIWDWNVTTNEVYFSPRWKSMLGYEEHEVENTFAGWERLLHPEDRERALTQIQAYFSGASPTYELEHRLRHKDGSDRWILARGIALRDEQGRPVRMAGSHVDLTERKHSEEKLRTACAELAHSQENLRRTVEQLQGSKEELEKTQLQLIQAARLESVGTLAAGVAHEVKNPLQTILMGLEYLSNNVPSADETVVMALGDMRDAVKRANDIIRELLQLAAASDFDLKEEDLNEVVERSLWLLNHELVAAQIDVVRHLQALLPRVRIDRGKIEQVLINLFINALQAMPPKGTLSVTTRSGCLGDDLVLNSNTARLFRPGEQVVVAEVRDTGPGIPEPHLARIFDPFFTTKPVGVGTGLGLSVVKKIIDLHEGAIAIHNAAEGGALVTLVLRAQEKETSWTRIAS